MKATNKLVGSLVCAAAFALAANQVSAVNLIQNPGFETGDFTSWLVLGATGTVQTPDNGPTAAGTHNAFLDNEAEAANLALKQTTASGSVGAGVLVSYSFDLKSGVSANGGVLFVHIFDQNSADVVLGEPTGLIGPLFPPSGSWQTYTGSFTTLVNTDHLTIEIDATTGAASGSEEQMHVDNVQLNVAAVPEPTTLTLVGVGLLGALMVRRNRKA
ncbi:MAG TPA: PEP-CTERM sorting domain-containing protein [Verrucomicrobiae bacterium]|nr:PEP-CTERM sorting domain-containing protein [Verrucomicrobiae bacterium]